MVSAAIHGACASPVALSPDSLPSVQTDSTVNTLQSLTYGYRTTVRMTYTNPHPFSVALPTCHGMLAPSLQRLVDGAWVAGWNPVHLMCLGPAIRVTPGETYEYLLAVFAGYPGGNTYPVFEADPPDGIYRAVWLVALAAGAPVRAIPLDARASNAFRLERPPR